MHEVKEKLVELIRCADYHPCKGAVRTIGSKFSREFIEDIADHLIAHGVTVQECNIGDKIYRVDRERIYEKTIQEITITANQTIFVTENIAFDKRAIGKSIFLSYAEAEAHLPQPPKG